jgi:hypothetical protein
VVEHLSTELNTELEKLSMLQNVARQEIERLDKVYVCKACKTTFLFKGDVEDHMQHMPRHQDFVIVPLNSE